MDKFIVTFLLCSSFIFVQSRTNQREFNRNSEITRLVPISSGVDPDIQNLRNFIQDLFTQNGSVEESRTFGHKRIQFFLMPMMYKMGAMMTMLGVLTVISLKGLLIGVILLVLKLSTFLAKFYAGSQSHQAWPSQPQPVHVHLHNVPHHAHSQAYSAWDPSISGASDHYY